MRRRKRIERSREMLSRALTILLGFSWVLPGGPIGKEPVLRAWWVDSLRNLLVTDIPEATERPGIILCARGETEAIQLAVRSNFKGEVSLEMDPFPNGLKPRVRRVGRVPVRKGTPATPREERVCDVPAELPDPLLNQTKLKLIPGRTESFWIDVQVPGNARPGLYKTRAYLRITGMRRRTALELTLRIFPATVPFEGRFKVTNWFRVMPEYLGLGKAKIGSKKWWEAARLLFDSMWAHRQNFFWTPLREPWIKPYVDEKGKLGFDFSFFDKWVEEVSRPRGGKRKTYIEGRPIAVRKRGIGARILARVWIIKDGKPKAVLLDPKDPKARDGYRVFLTSLKKHLEKKGLVDRFRIHIADEPAPWHFRDYKIIAGYIRKFAPGVKIMEALDISRGYVFFEKNLDVWVPQLGRFEKEKNLVLEQVAKGREVWIYTCLYPRGRYPNRLIDYPLIKTRILPWIAFRWGFHGFLHWGFNFWRGNPFGNLEPPHGIGYLPPGDAWIVYPGKQEVLDSMRHEALRDGIEDYELLWLLLKKDPHKAMAIASAMVNSFTEYERDADRFRRFRKLLLQALQ